MATAVFHLETCKASSFVLRLGSVTGGPRAECNVVIVLFGPSWGTQADLCTCSFHSVMAVLPNILLQS